jgi:hypothetical protein
MDKGLILEWEGRGLVGLEYGTAPACVVAERELIVVGLVKHQMQPLFSVEFIDK